VREITRKALIFDRLLINASVIPSEKYSCSGSPERFTSGNTATEWIGGLSTNGRFASQTAMVASSSTRRPAVAAQPALKLMGT
jgi:hypothetical protein